jgi:hypothetical protein
MLLGTAKAIITPPIGTPLAGFGFRDHGSEAVLDDLELRVFWLQHETDDTRTACIVCADIIGFDAALATQLKKRLTDDHPLGSVSILLCASHTHSGPQTCSNMIGVGVLVPEVVTSIHDAILAAVLSARMELHPVQLNLVRVLLEGYSINRRVIVDGRATSGPNPTGERDDEVSSIVFSDAATSEIRALLYHFTCHPTTMGSYMISSEYPGVARRHIEKRLGERVAAGFLPGCFGDVRPNCTYIGGKQFRRGQPEDVATFGTALGEAVLSSLTSAKLTGSQRQTTSLRSGESVIHLPHLQVPTEAELLRSVELSTGVTYVWAKRLLAHPPLDSSQLVIQRLDLTDEITLLTMGGEVCCGYGRYIKQLPGSRNILPLGYTNGIVGYIPTAEMFSEGGYEVFDSTVYFGLPSPFSIETDQKIRAGIRKLMEDSL